MVVRELKVKDYLGNDREYKLYFNMDENEIMELEFGNIKGGISEFYGRILRAQDLPSIIRALKDVIAASYGIVTADGEGFQKSPEIMTQFTYTKAYSEFMTKLYTDDEYGQAFLKELFPEEIMKKILARLEENNKKREAAAEAGQIPQTSQQIVQMPLQTPVQ
ncbi:MAG: hypothetical protein IJ115_06300 [Erysipelotrichaceae bacterium]|nr:hypothetical protein [Erysipelotrichaceae bacterium]